MQKKRTRTDNPKVTVVETEHEQLAMMKNEMRELNRTIANNTDQVFENNQLLRELLLKINAATALGSIAKNFLGGMGKK